MSANTGRLNPGIEYQFKVITYAAVCLSENPDVENFIMYTNKEEIPGFDDIIAKVWYKSRPTPVVYLGQIKHRNNKINLNNKANNVRKYKENISEIFANEDSTPFLQELFASVPDENVEFWFFCSKSVLNSKNNDPIKVDGMQYNVVPDKTYQSIFSFTKGAGCHKLTPNDTTRDSDILDKFYLLLDQPDNKKINEQIIKRNEDAFTKETTSQIITYVTEYLQTPVGSRGLRKDVFETQLLRLCLSVVTIPPTEAVDINDNLAWFWNELTLDHDITIVDQGAVDMKPYLFGAVFKVLQKILNDSEFNWNSCIRNLHKLPEKFNFYKFVKLTKINNTYYWLSKPDILDTLIVEMWKCDYIPLILSSECNTSVLQKYQHLKKKFIILDTDHKISNELRSSDLSVCANMGDIRTNSRGRELLQSVYISLQGREPVKFANVLDNHKKILGDIRCSHVLNLIKNTNSIFVNKECLEHDTSMVFIISNSSLSNKEASDDWKSSFASLRSTFKEENVIINCESPEVVRLIAQVKSHPNLKNYSMYYLKRHYPTGKLEYLAGDKLKIKHFLIDETGLQMYIQEKKVTPIIGTRLCKEEDQYITRYLRKATVQISFLNFEEERILFLTGDVDSLGMKIGEKIMQDFSGDIKEKIEKKLKMKKSAFISVEDEQLEEYWSMFATNKYPIFHIDVENGVLVVLKYKNYQKLAHYIAYEKEGFDETKFFDETPDVISVISGEAGVGKTELLQSLFERYNKNNFVLFCDLIDYRNEIGEGTKNELFKRPLKYILSRCEHSLPSNCLLPNNFFNSLCEFHHKTNRLLLIIDSFDEVFRMYEKELLEFIRIIFNSNVRVIITCGITIGNFLINNFEVQPIRIEYLDKNSAITYLKSRKLEDTDISSIPEELLENPLYLKFLSICSKDIFSKCNSSNKFHLYRAIIEMQIERFCKKKRVTHNLTYREGDILNVYELLALASIFGKEVLIEDQELNYDGLIEEFMRSYKIDLGIVTGFRNGYPIFARQSFAQFLVALWIYENSFTMHARKMYRRLLDINDRNIRLLLDNYVCENLELHKAILEKDLQLIEKICAENKNTLQLVDKYKRTPLHLAASYCSGRSIDGNISVEEADEYPMYKILDTIIRHMNKDRCDFLGRDLLMGWTWFEYIKQNKDLFEILCRNGLCATLESYLDLSEVIIKENYIDNAFRYNQIHVAVILLRYNPSLVIKYFDKLVKYFLNTCELNPILDLIELQNSSDDKFNTLRRYCRNMQPIINVQDYRNFQINGEFTALHLACMYGNIEVVKKLVKLEVDLYSFDKFKNISLHYAVMRGSSQLVSKLIRYMTDKNSIASKYLKLKFKIREESENYYINVENSLGRTPLHIASKIGNQDVVQNLLHHGANIESYDKEGKTALHFAVLFRCISVLEKLLEYRASVSHKDNAGNTAIHYAAQMGDVDIVNALLATDVDVNIKDHNGNTPLHIAVSYEYMKIVKVLIKNGANTNIQNNSCNTVLHNAIVSGKTDIVEALLEGDINVNMKGYNGHTALHLAAYYGQTDCFRMLLCNFANFNIKDIFGDTPLHCAVQKGHIDIVRMLLQNKIAINIKGRHGNTPLHTAAYFGQRDSFEILLENGANPNIKNDRNETVFHIVSAKGNVDNLQMLLRKYIDFNFKEDEINTVHHSTLLTKNNSNTPALHLAAKNGNLDVLKLLLKEGTDINFKDEDGLTPLCVAASYGQMKALELLLENGADLDGRDRNNNTALHLVAQEGKTDVAEIFLKRGMDVDLKGCGGDTPLCLAAAEGHIDTIGLLLENGAVVSIRNDLNNTACHVAAQAGKTNIVRMFIKNGIDVNLKGFGGNTSLMLAARNGYVDTLDLLLEHGAEVNITNDDSSSVLYVAAQEGRTDIVEALLKKEIDIDLKGFKGSTPVLLAASQGHIDTLGLLIDNKADLHITNDNHYTVLHAAAQEGRTIIVEMLLKKGMDVNLKSVTGGTPLFFAAAKGHVDTLRLLLDNGADVHIVNNYNNTALHTAAAEGKTDIVEILLKKGINVNLRGSRGRTPLWFAVFEGHTDTLNLLLENGAFMNVMDVDASTVLHAVAKKGKTDIVAMLLKKGMYVNFRGFNGYTPLTFAVIEGHIDTVRFLLENGAEVNIRDYECNTVLHAAAQEGRTDIVQILLGKKMDVNLKGFIGRTPLWFAAYEGHTDILRILLEHGADVNIIDVYNNSVLHAAAQKDRRDIVEILLKREINVNLKGFAGTTALWYTAYYGYVDTLRLLLEHGADINVVDDDNCTVLHVAAQEGRTDIVGILLGKKMDVNLKGFRGRTPLWFAAYRGYTDALRLLLENGGDVNVIDDDKCTVLHVAAQEGRVNIVKMLLKDKMDVNLRGLLGRTPLWFATYPGHIDTLGLLIENGSDVNIIDDDNNTVLHLAALEGRRDIVEVLLKLGMDVNFKGSKGNTPLFFAASKGNIAILKLLIGNGANLSIRNDCNNTSLHAAVQGGRANIIEVLLNKGMDVNLKGFGGDTPVCLAARNGSIHVLRLLLENKADTNIRNDGNYTALDLAALYDKTDAKLLLKKRFKKRHP